MHPVACFRESDGSTFCEPITNDLSFKELIGGISLPHPQSVGLHEKMGYKKRRKGHSLGRMSDLITEEDCSDLEKDIQFIFSI